MAQNLAISTNVLRKCPSFIFLNVPLDLENKFNVLKLNGDISKLRICKYYQYDIS